MSKFAEPRAAPVAGDQPEDRAEHEHAAIGVDEHHPAPAGALGQQAAEEHAGGGGEPADAAPDAERLVAVRALLEASW